MRCPLFSGSEGRLLQMVFDSYRSKQSQELCVMLFCTLFEHHLTMLLRNRCIRLKIHWSVIDLLLESYWRVDDRLKLFERLTGSKARDALAGKPVASVFNAYDCLHHKRNDLAHGIAGVPVLHYER